MEKRLMTPEDILNLSVPGSLSAAADGERILWIILEEAREGFWGIREAGGDKMETIHGSG